MNENVVPVGLDIGWEPNVPAAVLLSNDDGQTALALNSSINDVDTRSVVFVWEGVRFASMGSPNDEALSGHRLYARGLDRIVRLGKVMSSELIAILEVQNSVHPQHEPAWFAGLTHHVLPLKECMVEVVADTLTIRRIEGSTLEAAAFALAR